MSDENFKLDSTPGPLGVAGLRAALASRGVSVSAVTIRAWAEQGMPGVKTPDGWKFADVAACAGWIKANVRNEGQRAHGGTRENAGRPVGSGGGGGSSGGRRTDEQTNSGEAAAGPTLAKVIERAEELDEHRQKIKEAIGKGTPAPLDLSRAGDPEYLAWLSSVGLPAKEMDRLEQGVKIQQRQVELDKLRGKLLDRDDTLAAVADHASVVRSHLEALPEQLARRLVGEMQLPVERAAVIRSVAAEIVRAVGEALSAQPLGGDEEAQAA